MSVVELGGGVATGVGKGPPVSKKGLGNTADSQVRVAVEPAAGAKVTKILVDTASQ
jgi:hypothetical protein